MTQPVLSKEAVVVLTVVATVLVGVVPVVDHPAFTAVAGTLLAVFGVLGVRPRVWSESSHSEAVGDAYTKGRISGLRDG